MVPSDVVKFTAVPLCGGVPPDSSTCATIVAVPLTGSALIAVVRVIVEPVGAVSGTFSQPTMKRGAMQSRKRTTTRDDGRGIIKTLTS
jgi:hypothetical protein